MLLPEFNCCSYSYRGVLHSNPMDYAWGANGLDAIITQVKLALQWSLRSSWVVLTKLSAPIVLQQEQVSEGVEMRSKVQGMLDSSALV